MKNTKKIYYGSLYRFGGSFECVGETKAQVIEAIMAEYERVYRKENNADPREEYRVDPDTNYYEEAIIDIEIREMEIGKVEWF